MSCLVGRLLYATRSKGSSPGAPTAFPPTSALRMPAVAPTVVWTAVQQFSSRLVKSPDSRMSSVSVGRSEEHTSELQSLMRISYAVFCLKKKKKNNNQNNKITQHKVKIHCYNIQIHHT